MAQDQPAKSDSGHATVCHHFVTDLPSELWLTRGDARYSKTPVKMAPTIQQTYLVLSFVHVSSYLGAHLTPLLRNSNVSKASIVSSVSKNRGAVATSGQTHVPDDQTTTSSPPRKKLKHKSATRRGSSAELSTVLKQAAVSSHDTGPSSDSVPDTSLRSATGVSSRMSARLATKIHPFMLSKSRDIYPYLASKDSLDSADPFREERGVTGSSRPSAPTLKKKRGEPPRNICLADEGAKAALMEQWANLRMSQGTLLSSTSADRDTTPHPSSNRGSREPRNEAEIPSGEVVEPDKSHPAPANDHIESTCPRPSDSPSDLVAEPLSEMPATNQPVFTPPQAERSAAYNTSAERLPLSDYDLRYPSSSPENVHPAIENMAPSQYVDDGTMETIAPASHLPVNDSLEVEDQPLQLLATDSEIVSLHPPSSPIMSKLDILPETTISADPAAPVELEDSSTRASLSAVDIQLVVSSQADIDDVVLGFHMLDLHEVLSPWVPISPTAPSVYVPPAVQHLITAMNRQLEIECQARRRAEELYLEEMRKRIKMEEMVDKLQKEWGQTREQGASQQPPSLDAAPRAASAHASPEVALQQDSEAKPTSTDTTHPNVTTEGPCV